MLYVKRVGALMAMVRPLSSSSASSNACSAVADLMPYTLIHRTRLSTDSFLLRFSLPKPFETLADDPNLPTCIKVAFANGTDEAGSPKVLEKSYSPVSHPATKGSVELVVKAYPPRAGGGVGAYLGNHLRVGETMHAAVKSKRIMHGDPSVLGRWTHIGLVAGGTGVAPLLQIARILLEEEGGQTVVQMLSINRHEEDILMRDELDRLAVDHAGRFYVTYSLTAPPPAEAGGRWLGLTGRGDVAMVKQALPRPTGDGKTMVLVCGTDGFVATWGGPVGRAPSKPDGTKGGKIQGPLTGLLAAAGFDASEVFKY
jgi:cytochrome-b5 reductase